MTSSQAWPWLPPLPSDRPLVRLGFISKLQTGFTVHGGRDLDGDVVTRPYLRVANVQAGQVSLDDITEISVPREMANRSTLRAGDVLMTEGGDLDKLGRGTVWQDEIPGCLHQNHVFAIRPDSSKLNANYLAWVTQSLHGRCYFESTGSRTTNLASTNSSKIMSFPIPLPDLDLQKRIADFLDSECYRLNRLTEALHRQIELLDSREDSVLHELTSLSNTSVTRIKHVVRRLTSGPRGWGELISDFGVPFIRITNIPRRGIALSLDDLAYANSPAGPERERTRTRAGDVLVSITADIGSVGIIDTHTTNGNVSQHVCLLRVDESICHPRWLAYAIKAPAVNRALKMISYGGTKVGLGLSEIAEAIIPLPSLTTQDRQIKLIDEALAWNESLRDQLTKKATLISERKQALITAAVTGQVDVTTARG
ncbi:restriction endonuclease subunit S [Streptosporangium soli]|nr:restriction endonuclease subunit S [Streptosporangium sp. KLBMP 9127]